MKKVKGMQEVLHEVFLEEASTIESIIDSYIHKKVKPKTDVTKLFVSLRKKGYDIHKIMMAVFSVREKWFKEKGVIDLEVDFAEEIKKRDERNKEKLVYNNAIIRLLSLQLIPAKNPLEEALYLNVNKRVDAIRKATIGFKEIIDEYLRYRYPVELNQNIDDGFNVINRESALEQHYNIFKMFYYDQTSGKVPTARKLNVGEVTLTKVKRDAGKVTTKIKLTHSTEGVWNDGVIGIVDELTRLDCSQRQAFKTTETILHLFYPDYYSYSNGERAKSMYKYHKVR
jgi:hypothetical protein